MRIDTTDIKFILDELGEDGWFFNELSPTYISDANSSLWNRLPDSLLQDSGGATNEAYNIRGQFLDGRASYLDMSATTPLDPRVFDAMAPYMVRKYYDC